MPGLKTIYSRDGTPIADIRAAVVRSSLLNDIGEAIFSIAIDSIKCRRELLEFGNWLYVQNDSLSDWVGMIDTPRTWHNGYVEVHAFEAPFLLQYRPAPRNATITGTPGSLFTQLLDNANSQEDTLIQAGSVFAGGAAYDIIVNDSTYKHIKDIATNNHHEWVCTPAIVNQRLVIVMSWLERAGTLTDLELAQGKNILYGDTPLDESGEILNSIEALSETTDEAAIVANYEDTASRNRYGLRRIREVFQGIPDGTALLSVGKQAVTDKGDASFATPLTVVNTGNAFANIRLGNIAKYKYTNVGFFGDSLGMEQFVRIEGYRFDEPAGTVELFTGKYNAIG